MLTNVNELISFLKAALHDRGAAIICCGAVLAGALVVHFLLKMRSRAKNAEKRTDYFQTALECQPDGFYLWLYDDVGFLTHTRCSARLSVMMNLKDGQNASFDAILERLSPADADALTQALLEMRESGRPFCLSARAAAEGKRFLINGFRAFQTNTKVLLDIVWVRDVTELNGEIDALSDSLTVLKEREFVFKNIFDAFPFPVWLRGEDLHIVMSNRAYAAAVRAASSEDDAAPSGELVYEKSPREARVLAAAARAAGREHKTQEYIVVNGRRRRLEVSEIPLKKHDGAFQAQTVGFARDVTPFQEIEDELKRHINAHNGVLEHLKTPVAVFDLKMQLTFYNTAFMNLFDLEEEWLDSSPSYAHFIDTLREKRKLPENRDFNAYKSKELHYFSTLVAAREDTMHLPNGLTLRRTMTPHPLGGLLIVYEDVTGHLVLERSMNLMNDTQRALLDGMSEAVLVFSNSSRVRFVNRAYADLWDVSVPLIEEEKPTVLEILEKQKPFFEGQADWEPFKEQLFGAISAHENKAFEILRPDGKILEFSASSLPDGGILTVYRDKTQTNQEAARLKEKSTVLTQLNTRLHDTAKQENRFWQTVCDLQNKTLKKTREASQKLQSGSLSAQDSRKYLQTMTETTADMARLQQMTADVLAVQRLPSTAELDSVEIRPFLEKIVQTAAPALDSKSLTADINADGADEYCITDKKLLAALFSFLLNVCADSAKKKTKIILNTEKTPRGTHVFSIGFTLNDKTSAFFDENGFARILAAERLEKQGGRLFFEQNGQNASVRLELPAFK